MAETVKLKKRDWERWTPARITPIVADATHTVRCVACGYAHDSDADTQLEALDEVAAMHDPAHSVALRVAWSKSDAEPVAPTGVNVPSDAASLLSMSPVGGIAVGPSA